MGLFGGWRKKKASDEEEAAGVPANPNSSVTSSQQQQQQAAPETSVFEFGSANAAGEERLTIAGYCPVSNDLEPCRWEVLPAPATPDNTAPLFRIVF
ncbi:hypothetical protein L7F22_023495 [Adiantum nelumboides]|nr:hypothetical protein [Adiantum nelumboides]